MRIWERELYHKRHSIWHRIVLDHLQYPFIDCFTEALGYQKFYIIKSSTPQYVDEQFLFILMNRLCDKASILGGPQP